MKTYSKPYINIDTDFEKINRNFLATVKSLADQTENFIHSPTAPTGILNSEGLDEGQIILDEVRAEFAAALEKNVKTPYPIPLDKKPIRNSGKYDREQGSDFKPKFNYRNEWDYRLPRNAGGFYKDGKPVSEPAPFKPYTPKHAPLVTKIRDQVEDGLAKAVERNPSNQWLKKRLDLQLSKSRTDKKLECTNSADKKSCVKNLDQPVVLQEPVKEPTSRLEKPKLPQRPVTENTPAPEEKSPRIHERSTGQFVLGSNAKKASGSVVISLVEKSLKSAQVHSRKESWAVPVKERGVLKPKPSTSAFFKEASSSLNRYSEMVAKKFDLISRFLHFPKKSSRTTFTPGLEELIFRRKDDKEPMVFKSGKNTSLLKLGTVVDVSGRKYRNEKDYNVPRVTPRNRDAITQGVAKHDKTTLFPSTKGHLPHRLNFTTGGIHRK